MHGKSDLPAEVAVADAEALSSKPEPEALDADSSAWPDGGNQARARRIKTPMSSSSMF